MLELVKGSRIAYHKHLDVLKAEDQRENDLKRRREEEDKDKIGHDTAVISLKEQIKDEQHRLRAAQNLFDSGREKLSAALLENPMKKALYEEAKVLIDMGADKSKECESNISNLQRKLTLLHKTK